MAAAADGDPEVVRLLLANCANEVAWIGGIVDIINHLYYYKRASVHPLG